ncbi:MAG: oxidoreductase [Caulobacteraceae bacterium]
MRTLQAPILSGFGPATTAEEALAGADLTGKVAIVTGGYSGLGLETARVLTKAGAQVVVPARDAARARAALEVAPGVELEALDLMDPASIDGFASRFLASGRPLHMLVNSAGVMACLLARDARGNEAQFSTNHLGHFRLAARLWPALVRASGARVVAVSSYGHRRSAVDFDDPNFLRRAYEPWQAYGQSKTANILFAIGLDRRGETHGVRAVSLHPGAILTPLARHMSQDLIRTAGAIDDEGRPVIDPANDRKTVEQGAATSVWCAVSPQLAGMGGVYCEDCDIARLVPAGEQGLRGLRPWGDDPQAAERLWRLSEELTGVGLA